DHILILPAMFTGNTDWKSSPLGRIEGGYILASTINSVLKAKWLRVVDNSFLFVIFAALVAFLCHRLSLHKSLWLMFGIVFSYLIVVHSAFVYLGLMLP